MSPLLPELDRLYGPDRAMVLEVVLPAGWDQLSHVWKAVQSELELPAPAIAVSGVDGLQLWFSLAAPTSSSTRARFLQRLRQRYLSSLAPAHVRVFADAAETPTRPPVEISAQRWAAFITSDLVSIFFETPWLDIPPTDEGQAAILRALSPMQPVAYEVALNKLVANDDDARHEATDTTRTESKTAKDAAQSTGTWRSEPARFLANVMNDESAPLALRIEAAKALLPFAKSS